MDQNTGSVPKRSKLVRTLLEWVEELVIAVVLIAVVFTFACRVITVTGTSMVPNFHSGDRVLVVNDFTGVEQGDVVVIVNVLQDPIIKRVIATEGQTVDLDYNAGTVLVDGQVVETTLINPLDEYDFSTGTIRHASDVKVEASIAKDGRGVTIKVYFLNGTPL